MVVHCEAKNAKVKAEHEAKEAHAYAVAKMVTELGWRQWMLIVRLRKERRRLSVRPRRQR